eukprot:366206-Chlamydomonas_euryale.AAC.8
MLCWHLHSGNSTSDTTSYQCHICWTVPTVARCMKARLFLLSTSLRLLLDDAPHASAKFCPYRKEPESELQGADTQNVCLCEARASGGHQTRQGDPNM